MKDDVKNSVRMRTDFFEKYYSVPENMRGEVDGFILEINALGESCENVMTFEERFASRGLSEKFNLLLTKCTPCPPQMTQEEKQHSRQVAKEMFRENKEQILKDVAMDAVDTLAVKAESELIAQNRKRMIEDGTFDEYTKATNLIDDAKTVGNFFLKKFKKK